MLINLAKTKKFYCFVLLIVGVCLFFPAGGFFSKIIMAQADQVCAPNSVSGCRVCNLAGTDWIDDNLKCTGGKICLNGECITDCRNECRITGLKECWAGGYRVCVNNENTGCLHWSGIFACPAGEKCANGVCVKNLNSANEGLALSNFAPFGILSDSKIILKVVTSVAANCHYDFLNRSFDLMSGNFITSDYSTHTAPMSLLKQGDYIYYVNCRDGKGNIASGTISFTYASKVVAVKPAKPEVVETPASGDSQPPIISQLKPSGDIYSKEVELSFLTDESALCNYDVFDTDYDSMENSMAADNGGLNHRHKIILVNSGKYAYYVRCKDKAGNKNSSSAKIDFEYTGAESGIGPAMVNLSPYGAIYQSEVALMVGTDVSAQCRYGIADMEFDKMTDNFATDDGLLHQAMVSLDDYGPYNYFVRCKDDAGAVAGSSMVVSLEYQDPTVLPAMPVKQVDCAQYVLGEKDDVCDYGQNCVCDPDCAKSGEYDADCDQIITPKKNIDRFVLWGLIIAAAVAVFSAAIFVFKKIKKNPAPMSENEGEFLD